MLNNNLKLNAIAWKAKTVGKRARVEIVVEAQAVQSKNNGTSALDAQGWTDVTLE